MCTHSFTARTFLSCLICVKDCGQKALLCSEVKSRPTWWDCCVLAKSLSATMSKAAVPTCAPSCLTGMSTSARRWSASQIACTSARREQCWVSTLQSSHRRPVAVVHESAIPEPERKYHSLARVRDLWIKLSIPLTEKRALHRDQVNGNAWWLGRKRSRYQVNGNAWWLGRKNSRSNNCC